MNKKIKKSKKIAHEYLTLESLISDADFPGQEVYFLALRERPEVGYRDNAVLLLTSPDAYILSKAAYEALFDAIRSRTDFFKFREELMGEIRNVCRIIYDANQRPNIP